MTAGKLPRWADVVALLAPLSVYVYTAAPGVTLIDSGEFAAVCPTLSIAHPPGVPTYVLLGYLFSLLPVSASIARRMNLFSACAAALTVWLAYRLTCALLDDVDYRMALAGALAFGFSLSLWHWAAITEVYALNVCFIAIVYLLAARGRWIPAAFFVGLALGIHHATVAMALPAAAFLLWTRSRPSLQRLAAAAGAMAAGLCVYLYLPIRAAQHPMFNWGDPRTAERFWWHFTGKMYLTMALASTSAGFFGRVEAFFRLWFSQMLPLGLVLTIIGLAALWRTRRRIFWFTSLVMALNLAFVWIVNLGGPDIAGYYLPAFLASSWCFAAGADWLLSLPGGARPDWAVAVVFAAAIVPGLLNFPANNHREDRIASLYLVNSFRDMPPNSLIVTSDQDLADPWLYARSMEGFRRDVVLVHTGLMRKSWYLDFLRSQYPALMDGASAELSLLAPYVDLEERHQALNQQAIQAYVAFLTKLTELKRAERTGVFVTMKLEPPFAPRGRVSPHGVVFSCSAATDDVELDLSGLLGEIQLDDGQRRIQKTYADMLYLRAVYSRQSGNVAAAAQKIDLALRLDPANVTAQRLQAELSAPSSGQ